jgi:D-arabinose 1-dehydrogenase-like Zn-dependent alcohol dehydrogenase
MQARLNTFFPAWPSCPLCLCGALQIQRPVLISASLSSNFAPPGTGCDSCFPEDGAFAIDVKAIRATQQKPFSHGLIGSITAVAVMVTGTDEQRGMESNAMKIFFDNNDLHVEVQCRAEIKQIAANDDQIIFSRIRHEPVELLERIGQIGGEEHSHRPGDYACCACFDNAREGSYTVILDRSANVTKTITYMSKMRAVQISRPNGPFEIVERDIPEPGPGRVRIKIQACGICHSDTLTKEGTYPGLEYPRVPGHEVVGVVDAVGENVARWKAGQRVGVGWHGGNCGYCDSCRRGDFFACQTAAQVTGITHDGGYADYMIAPAETIAVVPEELSAVEAAPLMCAGITTFNCLRHSGTTSGELVAVLGLGGLGHLGVQYAAKMGFKTVAIARGKDKEPLAKKLGAQIYVDSQGQDPAAELLKLGGAKVILATVTNADAMSSVLGGLAVNGALMVIGAAGPIEVSPMLLIGGRRSVKGWYSGTSIDSQDTLEFSVLSGVRAMNEVYPLERVDEAYERMLSGKARFRVVLTTGN